MTRADNGITPLRRSRDTLTGAAPCTPQHLTPAPTPDVIPIMPVHLYVWGESAADVDDAERLARDSILAGLWDIRQVTPAQGGVCPIHPRDPKALTQGATYGQAWAAYPAWRG